MTAGTMSSNDQERYKYGGGPFLIGVGILFVVVILSMYDEMTSDKTEWHLLSTKFPIIIPNQVMVGFWWISLIFFGACTFVAMLPSTSVILNSSEIKVQSPLTRNFQTMAFADIQHIETMRHGFSIFDRNDRKITVNKQMLSRRAYKNILTIIQERTGFKF